MAGGEPVIQGTGVMTEILWSRFLAGESVAELVEDYGLSTEQVETAIRFEGKR